MTLVLVFFVAFTAGLVGAWMYAGLPQMKLPELRRVRSARAFSRLPRSAESGEMPSSR
jgi:hypothetical protein